MLENIESWDEFIAKYPNVIEYVDKEEEQNIMLAIFPHYIDEASDIMNKKPIKNQKELDRLNRTNRYDGSVYDRYTHCEIHPSMILGLISSNIPFPDHNQSPRGIFQYNQARQAMGLYISDYRERTDISYILYHPQIPIVTSRTSKYTGTHIFPSGENVIVAIASYTGFKVGPCHSKSCGKSALWQATLPNCGNIFACQ
jgi:DNA-directed RNA polymerase II subunit RPB2